MEPSTLHTLDPWEGYDIDGLFPNSRRDEISEELFGATGEPFVQFYPNTYATALTGLGAHSAPSRGTSSDIQTDSTRPLSPTPGLNDSAFAQLSLGGPPSEKPPTSTALLPGPTGEAALSLAPAKSQSRIRRSKRLAQKAGKCPHDEDRAVVASLATSIDSEVARGPAKKARRLTRSMIAASARTHRTPDSSVRRSKRISRKTGKCPHDEDSAVVASLATSIDSKVARGPVKTARRFTRSMLATMASARNLRTQDSSVNSKTASSRRFLERASDLVRDLNTARSMPIDINSQGHSAMEGKTSCETKTLETSDTDEEDKASVQNTAKSMDRKPKGRQGQKLRLELEIKKVPGEPSLSWLSVVDNRVKTAVTTLLQDANEFWHNSGASANDIAEFVEQLRRVEKLLLELAGAHWVMQDRNKPNLKVITTDDLKMKRRALKRALARLLLKRLVKPRHSNLAHPVVAKEEIEEHWKTWQMIQGETPWDRPNAKKRKGV